MAEIPETEAFESKPYNWNSLTLLEKDVLLIIMAFCKVSYISHFYHD